MSEPAAGFTFGAWAPPKSLLSIEYPLEIMDELRAAACDGLQRLSRGGLEIGGVLFGARKDGAVRILTWRPIECEHASGPSFTLSAKDRDGLARLLESARSDTDLRGLQPAGWFLSHTRGEICLTAADLEIYAQFFPRSWQVTLVLRPERKGAARAGFFVREPGGRVQAESSYQEFSIEPLHPHIAQPSAPAGNAQPAPSSAQAAGRLVQPPRFLVERSSSAARKRLWAVPGALAVLTAGALIQHRMQAPAAGPASFALRVADQGQRLRIGWDKDSPLILASRSASLAIHDGAASAEFNLPQDQLRSGFFIYERQTADVELRMTLVQASGAAVRESARFIGAPAPPPAPDSELFVVTRDRDRLAADVKRLREQLRREKIRADRLERSVKTLQEPAPAGPAPVNANPPVDR